MRGKYKNNFETKIKISNSLKELMKIKSLSNITIGDITSNININRNTFYYHFEDINDLIRWTIEYDTRDVKKRFDITNHMEAFETILNYVDNNKYFLKNIECQFSENNLKKLFFTEIFNAIKYLIDTEEEKRKIKMSDDYKIFLCTFLTNAAGSTLVDYYLKNKKLTKEQVISYYSLTMTTIIKNINEENNIF